MLHIKSFPRRLKGCGLPAITFEQRDFSKIHKSKSLRYHANSSSTMVGQQRSTQLLQLPLLCIRRGFNYSTYIFVQFLKEIINALVSSPGLLLLVPDSTDSG